MKEGSGPAIGVAMAVFVFLTLLPFVLLVVLYVFFSIYGMTKGTDFRATTVNLPLLFAGLAAVTSALVLLMATAAGLVGRSLTPRKRRD